MKNKDSNFWIAKRKIVAIILIGIAILATTIIIATIVIATISN